MQPFTGELPAEFIAGKKLIGLGESNHGSHEFFAAKASIFKNLAENFDFDTIFLEDQPEACETIQNFITSNHGNLAQLMRRLYSVWQAKELFELIGWMQQSSLPLKFIGIDIDQSGESALAGRDKLMASNIAEALGGNGKGLVWAHNSHIQKSSQEDSAEPMGYYLARHFGASYASVGQFAASGKFRATIIEENSPASTDRTSANVQLPLAPSEFLESKLASVASGSYFLDFSKLAKSDRAKLAEICPAYSIGWGLVPKYVTSYVEQTSVLRQFDGMIFWPKVSPALPI